MPLRFSYERVRMHASQEIILILAQNWWLKTYFMFQGHIQQLLWWVFVMQHIPWGHSHKKFWVFNSILNPPNFYMKREAEWAMNLEFIILCVFIAFQLYLFPCEERSRLPVHALCTDAWSRKPKWRVARLPLFSHALSSSKALLKPFQSCRTSTLHTHDFT